MLLYSIITLIICVDIIEYNNMMYVVEAFCDNNTRRMLRNTYYCGGVIQANLNGFVRRTYEYTK